MLENKFEVETATNSNSNNNTKKRKPVDTMPNSTILGPIPPENGFSGRIGLKHGLIATISSLNVNKNFDSLDALLKDHIDKAVQEDEKHNLIDDEDEDNHSEGSEHFNSNTDEFNDVNRRDPTPRNTVDNNSENYNELTENYAVEEETFANQPTPAPTMNGNHSKKAKYDPVFLSNQGRSQSHTGNSSNGSNHNERSIDSNKLTHRSHSADVSRKNATPNGTVSNQNASSNDNNSGVPMIGLPIESSNPMDFIDEAKFLFLNLLGRGSYGKVCKAVDREGETDQCQTVAIKILDNVFRKTEDAKRIFREVFLLKRLSNPYIIRLVDIVLPENSAEDAKQFTRLGLVFDYVDTDLFRLITSNQFLHVNHVQFIMLQLLQALNYLHHNKIVHRDLKPANVLIFSNCKIKICDFGLARVIDDKEETVSEDIKNLEADLIDSNEPNIDPNGTSATKIIGENNSNNNTKLLNKKLTKHVVTRWYRAPELILLLRYDTKIDIWSAGCILGELLQMIHVPFMRRTPLFPGKSCFPLTAEHEQVYQNKTDQLNEIFKVIGTPTYEDVMVEELVSVRGYLMSLERKKAMSWAALFPGIHPLVLNLLTDMLKFSPKKRASAHECLLSDFFQLKKKFRVTVETCRDDLKLCEEESAKNLDVDGYRRLMIREALEMNQRRRDQRTASQIINNSQQPTINES